MRKLNWKSALIGSTSLLCLSTSVAYAQAMPATSANDEVAANAPEQIVVTARRVDEKLQDVPISIRVFNQEQITDRNIVSAQDLSNYTPSLSTNTGFGGDNTTFALRGFVQDYGTQPSVGVYFADVVAPRGGGYTFPSGDGAGPGSFFDLQNVQVVRGPQGTLQGRNTTGGAVLFVPRKPTNEFGGYIEGSIGNYDLRRLQGAVNLPISDTAAFRLAVDHQDRDGYLRNRTGIGPKDLADLHYTAVRASLVVDLTPTLENYLIASYIDSKNNGNTQKLTACAPSLGRGAQFACPQLAREAAAGFGFYDVSSQLPNPRSTLEQMQLINTTTWDATDQLTIKNIASYAQSKSDLMIALYGVDWKVNGLPLTFNTIGTLPGISSSDQSTFTEELQFQGRTMDERLTYQFGAYLETSDPLGPSGNLGSSLLSCTDISRLQCSDPLGIVSTQANGNRTAVRVGTLASTVGRLKTRDYGLYGQASYSLTDQLKFTAGLRYTWDEQESTTTRISYRFPVLPPLTAAPTQVCVDAAFTPTCTETINDKSSAPTWLIDFDYTPIDDVLLYVKYSRGYRAGGVFPTGPIGYRTFDPERVDAYETGIKTSFDGAIKGTLNAAAFYNDFTDQQLRVVFTAAPGAPVSSATGVVNAGKSRIWGIEAEGSIEPFPNFQVEGAYTYLNTEIRRIVPLSSVDANYSINYAINPGLPLTLSPKHKITATASYRVPLGEIGQLKLAATYAYTDRQIATYTFINPALVAAYKADYTYLPSFSLVNVNAGWLNVGGSSIDVEAFVNNLTNEKYYSYYGAGAGQGTQTAILGQPRFYGARVRYRF